MKANKESFSALAETAIVKVQGKITQAKKTTSLFPKNWRKPQEGERLVYRRTPLFSAYVFIVSLSVLAFVGQWYFYMGLTETQTVITGESGTGEYIYCEGLTKDELYGKMWSYEQCMDQWKETSDPVVQDFTYYAEPYDGDASMYGYSYYPFGTDEKEINITNTNTCYLDFEGSFEKESVYFYYPGTYSRPLLIDFSIPFDVQTNCNSSSLKDYFDGTRCGIYNYTTADSYKKIAFSMVYVGNDEAETYPSFMLDDQTGLKYGSANSFLAHLDIVGFYTGLNWTTTGEFGNFSIDQRCVPFENYCIAQAYKYLFEKREASCHPCKHFRNNAPFRCTKEIKKTSLEILSLSVSNTFAFFSFLVAVTPMVFMLWKKIRVVAVVEVDEEAAENAVEAKGRSEEKQEEDIRSA